MSIISGSLISGGGYQDISTENVNVRVETIRGPQDGRGQHSAASNPCQDVRTTDVTAGCGSIINAADAPQEDYEGLLGMVTEDLFDNNWGDDGEQTNAPNESRSNTAQEERKRLMTQRSQRYRKRKELIKKGLPLPPELEKRKTGPEAKPNLSNPNETRAQRERRYTTQSCERFRLRQKLIKKGLPIPPELEKRNVKRPLSSPPSPKEDGPVL